ncbi:MAG: YbbR-like domain-containing protein [Polyangiaceae bacterium]|nr:YbbR-like domain-containing protein [Polyangiaceae bacterium]
MTAAGGAREAVRAALLENLGLKILSLAFALALYAFIHGAENAQRTLAVSVVSIMPPDSANRQLMTQLPTEVAVTVRGSRTQLDDLRADELGTLQIDLRSGHVAHIDLDASMFHVPAGLSVEQIEPPTIDLRWDDVTTRPIPVQVPRTGEVAAGFQVNGAIAVDPPAVQARGPQSIVEVMQYAGTAPFDVTGLTEGSYQRSLALDRPPKLVVYDVDTVVATVDVTRVLISRTFDRKIEVVGLPRAKTIPPVVAVKITGTPESVNAIAPEAIVPRVEPKLSPADAAQAGSAYLDVLVDVGGLKAEVSPPRVLVKW